MYTICRNINHNESVYNLIEQQEKMICKPPMYRSKYSKAIKEQSKGVSCCQPPVCRRKIPESNVCHSETYHNTQPICERGTKDFVMDNALKVIRQPAKIPQSYYVDHPKGTRHEWNTSGYPRKYVCRKDFGMIPGYLVQRKKELYNADQKAKEETEHADAVAAAKCRHLDETERQMMICGLKSNWAEKFHEFQSLPLFIDTAALVKKKSDLEQALKDLEKDIQFMERHNHIFVSDTPKTFYLD